MSKERKTRQLSSKEDWICPVHGKPVQHRVRKKDDEYGRSRYAGEYYSCPRYTECGYYVTPTGLVSVID